MSGKFMKVKKLILPTLTMVIIASQLMGCAATNESELLQMLNTGQQIEIEIATPISEEQGEEQTLDWIQLDQLNTYADFRKSLEDIMKITRFGDNSKNGICYINLEGMQEGNNTLFNAMMNRKFIANFLENDTANLEVQQIMDSAFIDTDESNYMTAAINAYWNLLPDAEPNYFNPSQTLSRLEAMSLIARASTPVTEEIGNQSFTDAVGQSDFTDLASLVADDSYLGLSDKSLNESTANGTITRGEYIYMLVSNVFGTDRINSADTKKAQFNDCKDAGDIASQQKLSAEDTSKDYYDSAELKFTLDNPDGGCPTKMYQALAAAQELGIISSDTRWDEGLTKSEAIQLYLDTLQAYTNENGYPIDQTSGIEKPVTEINGYQVSQDEGETTEEFTLTEMDIQMIVNAEAYTYENPSNESTMIGVAQSEEVVHVIGQVDGTNWYKIEQGGGTDDIIVSFIDGEFLSEYTEPEEETPAEATSETETTTNDSSQSNENTGNTQQQQPQQPTQTQPQQPANTNDGPPPGTNIGDVVGENEAGANDATWGGHFSDF